MGQDPSEIRSQIEATRDRMSQTADAITYKGNVRARVKDKATAKKDALLGKARSVAPTSRQEAVEQLTATGRRLAGTARGVAGNPRQAREQAVGAARRNPPALAVAGGLALLLGVGAYRRASRSVKSPARVRNPGQAAGRPRSLGAGRRRSAAAPPRHHRPVWRAVTGAPRAQPSGQMSSQASQGPVCLPWRR